MKENSFKKANKFASVLGLVLFFILMSVSAKAQGNYLPVDQALDKLKQNALTITTLMNVTTPGSHAFFVLDTKLAFNQESISSIRSGSNVETALLNGSQFVIASLSRTPQLDPSEQKTIIQDFETLLSR
jgi:hypothetical protein